MQDLKPLCQELRGSQANTRSISAGMTQAIDKSAANRIGSGNEHDRRRCSGSLCRRYGQSASGDDNGGALTHQIRREYRQAFVVSVSPVVACRDIAMLDETNLADSLPKRGELLARVRNRPGEEKADHLHRLRSDGARPQRYAPGKTKELPPSDMLRRSGKPRHILEREIRVLHHLETDRQSAQVYPTFRIAPDTCGRDAA